MVQTNIINCYLSIKQLLKNTQGNGTLVEIWMEIRTLMLITTPEDIYLIAKFG